MTQWLVFVHLVGVFGFLMAHGVSVYVIYRVGMEKDIAALRALMGLSARASMATFFSLLVLLVGGIGAAFAEHVWGAIWPWAAIVVFVVV